jgi:hypothetical protein
MNGPVTEIRVGWELRGMSQALPFYDTSLLIRTDFSDDDVWADVCASALAPVHVVPGQSFQSQLECVNDAGFAGLTLANLLTLAPPGAEPRFVFLADSQSMGPEHLILAVDLSSDPSRHFRVIPDAMWSVENNLAQSNMNFSDFLAAVGEDGVFRGFTHP